MNLATVILAAGKGTRMKSELPKVLHKICGVAMIRHVLKAARGAGSDRIVVVAGYGGELVAKAIEGQGEVVFQHEQLGTAHALMQAASLQDHRGDILVLCGDTPLVTPETLKRLISAHQQSNASATVLTAVLDNPAGYGRVIRNDGGTVVKIVEHGDASPEELAVREINTGIYCFKSRGLFADLARLKPDNAQGEYYLPDLIGCYAGEGEVVSAVSADDPAEIMGVNDRCQLAMAHASMGARINNSLMVSGVTMIDPRTVFIDAGATIGRDTVVYPNTIIQGSSAIGEGCVIGPFTQIISASVGDNVTIRQSLIEGSEIGSNSVIGPYSYIRPGCLLGSNVKVGDFVELKKVEIGKGSKVPHLSYVGDAVLGQNVNVGAGTITCNYDGEKKWTTVIGDNAFIGSNTNLVAPVRVGSGAVVGAGSTITKDVPDHALGVARDTQKNIPEWSRRKKTGEKQDKEPD
ncbi:MAG: bifunctional N-acetylglucosamine-1-phosphate uridyltransferase/glucosamine-1-phosphate acetyltransferase [Peptococcaceae bacterium BRH_c4a]|nr:MAG: bifunctional N-acetylglucosamine-1-phosphate uridyltransferase/glucosamine-1-phosphate acetyltransferase [Peptococcaceae bacterium BRH_c4a]